MESITRRKRFNIISLITIIIISLVFGYYYFFYVKYKEHQFHEKAFRIMEQVEQNIGDKYSNDQKVILNSIDQARLESKNSSDFLKKFYNYFDTTGFPVKIELIRYNPQFDKLLITSHFDSNKVIVNVRSNTFEVRLSYGFSRLLANTMQHDFFKKYIALSKISADKGKVIYSDIPISPEVEISYDSLIKNSYIRHSSIISTIYYNGKPHIVYLIPVNLNEAFTVYIGGLIEKEYFIGETFRLNPVTLAAIFFALVLLILSLPILKLILLSDCERLSTRDVILSFIVKIAGTAFLMLMIVYLFSKYGPDYENRKQLLKSYADQIGIGLKNEIRDKLRIIDKKESVYYQREGNVKEKYYYDDTSRVHSFDFMTWMNKDGYQLVRWQPKKITPRANVSEREYFKYSLNQQLWRDSSISNSEFYFGSIVSWTTGKHNAIISKKVNSSINLTRLRDQEAFKNELASCNDTSQFFKPRVVTMGTELECLKALKLPSQISYMIIDQKGQVLFHKDKDKELQENLLKETDGDFDLKSALHGNTDMTFFQSYNSKNRMFHMSPIGTLPLFIVTFLDYDYEYIIDVQILSLSSLLYFTLFLTIIFITFIYLFIDFRRSYKVQGRELLFNWFWPSQQKGTTYFTLILSLIIVGFLYFLFGIYRNLYSSYVFFSLVFILNILYLKHYRSIKAMMRQWKDVAFFSSTIIPGIVINFMIPNASVIQKAGVLVSVVLFILMMSYSLQIADRLKFLTPKNYTARFNAYIFILILFLGLLPVYSFYKNAWEYEKELYVKNLQLSLARGVDQKPNKLSDTTIVKSFTNITKGKYHYSNASAEPEKGLIKRLRIALDTTVVASDVLNAKSSNESTHFFWQINSSDSLIIYSGGSGLTIQSARPLFSFRSLIGRKFEEKGIVLILIISFLVLLLVVYNFVTFWSRKVFLLKLIPHPQKDLNKMLTTNQNCIVVCTAFSMGLNHLLEQITEYSELRPDEKNLPLIDLSRSGDFSFVQNEVKRLGEKKFPKILIADYESYSKKNIETKIKLIDSLKEYARVNQYQQQIIILVPQLLTNINTAVYNLDEALFERYLETTSEFRKSYLPLGELNLPEVALSHLFDYEDAILYKQSQIHILYHSIWQNCTRREQYLIYDIAQDGLLNPKNLPVIYNLLMKGIFIQDEDGRIILFSNSFRNFVLTIINREQALQIENEAKLKGLWSNMKLPIILIILALFILVFVTNQGAFNNMIGWLTAALGSVAILSRVLSGFSMLNLFKGSGK